MPQPVTLKGFSKPRRAVLQRQDCAVLIAAIVAEWAYVEESLALLFSAAMGSHTLTKEGSASISRNWPALVAMREIESIHTRLKIVEKGLVPLLPKDLADKWSDVDKDLRARAKERNVAAHTPWALSDKYPNDLLCENRGGRLMRYTKQDFTQTLDRISAVYVRTYNFLMDVLKAQREGRARKVSH